MRKLLREPLLHFLLLGVAIFAASGFLSNRSGDEPGKIVITEGQIENLAAGLTERAPWAVAFTFGLLHGFGFAGALSQFGLPRQASLRVRIPTPPSPLSPPHARATACRR